MNIDQIMKLPDWIIIAVVFAIIILNLLYKLASASLGYVFSIASINKKYRIRHLKNLDFFEDFCNGVIKDKNQFRDLSKMIEILDKSLKSYINEINDSDKKYKVYGLFRKRQKTKLLNDFIKIQKSYTEKLTY